jgi:hypothetical protein
MSQIRSLPSLGRQGAEVEEVGLQVGPLPGNSGKGVTPFHAQRSRAERLSAFLDRLLAAEADDVRQATFAGEDRGGAKVVLGLCDKLLEFQELLDGHF